MGQNYAFSLQNASGKREERAEVNSVIKNSVNQVKAQKLKKKSQKLKNCSVDSGQPYITSVLRAELVK